MMISNIIDKLSIKSSKEEKSFPSYNKSTSSNAKYFQKNCDQRTKLNEASMSQHVKKGRRSHNGSEDPLENYKDVGKQREKLTNSGIGSGKRNGSINKLSLSEPKIVNWKNSAVYVYTVLSEQKADHDLEFVIYIPIEDQEKDLLLAQDTQETRPEKDKQTDEHLRGKEGVSPRSPQTSISSRDPVPKISPTRPHTSYTRRPTRFDEQDGDSLAHMFGVEEDKTPREDTSDITPQKKKPMKSVIFLQTQDAKQI